MIKTIKHNLALKLDSIGFIASTLCAIHCALMPFVFIFLAFYGLNFIADPAIELIFISTSVIIGIFTFTHGYFKHHKRLYPFAIFITGLIIVFTGHFLFHEHEPSESYHTEEILLLFISPIGAILIGVGHYLNRKLSGKHSKKCNH